jgi:hypothetical protein
VPDTFIKIAAVTVGSGGASSIDFTSIPSTYTDLCLKMSLRSSRSSTGDTLFMKFNSTSSTYTMRRIYAYGTTVGSDSSTPAGFVVGSITASTNTSNTFANYETYVPNYLSSNQKSISIDGAQESNTTSDYWLNFVAGLWNGTSAITSIGLTCDAGNFVQYSTATLYGIKNS